MFTIKNPLLLIIRNAIISFIVVIIVTISIYYVKNKIISTTQTITESRKAEAESKKRIELFSVINEDLKIIGQNESLIDASFVTSDNITNFISTLDTLASTHQIVQTYHFGSPVITSEMGPYSIASISYSILMNTNSSSLSLYLKEFENVPFFTKINSIEISSQDIKGIKGNSTILIDATLLSKSTQ